MKKQKVSKLDTDIKTKIEFKDTAELPTVEMVNASVQQLTGQTAAAQSGRPIKEAAIGRVKLTTMMQKSLIKWCKTYAIANDMTAADVLETAVSLFKHEKDMNR